MENVLYMNDRDRLSNLAFFLQYTPVVAEPETEEDEYELGERGAFVELDEFPDSCLGDPSVCTAGMCISFWIKVSAVTGTDTLIR